MSTATKNGKSSRWIALTIFVLVLGVIAVPCLMTFLPFVSFKREIDQKIAKIKKPEIYELAARALAARCATASESLDESTNLDWLPQVVLDCDPRWSLIEPKQARLEFGGGFHHFGYLLVKDKNKSNDETTFWQLHFVEDEERLPELLFEFEEVIENAPQQTIP